VRVTHTLWYLDEATQTRCEDRGETQSWTYTGTGPDGYDGITDSVLPTTVEVATCNGSGSLRGSGNFHFDAQTASGTLTCRNSAGRAIAELHFSAAAQGDYQARNFGP